MAIDQWKSSLRRLKRKVGVIGDKVRDACHKAIENPRYDGYADLSTASADLNGLMATIEGIKKYERMMPKGLRLQHIQNEVANVLEMVEHTRKRMLQDPRYSVIDATADIVGELNNLYDTLGDAVEHIGHGEE